MVESQRKTEGGLMNEQLTPEEIGEILLCTLRDLASGKLKVSRANAIFTGIRLLQIQQDYEPSGEGPIAPGTEGRDFAILLEELWERDPLREWHSPEIRSVAVDLSLFKAWLTSENADSYSSMSRFGLLCDRQLNRKHGHLSLTRRGCGRNRVFTITHHLAKAA